MHLYDLSWWVTWERNDARAELTISFRSFFCAIIPGGQFCHIRGRGIILTAFRRNPISDNQSANEPLNAKTCIWIREREREKERQILTWREHTRQIFECVWTPGGNQPWACLCLSVQIPTAPACVWVHACVCIQVCAQACINSLRSGWLCSQTAQSGCIATNSPHSPPSPLLLLLLLLPLFCVSVLNLQCNPKTFLTLSHTHLWVRRLTLKRHVSMCVFVSLGVCVFVCVMCACYLWVPQSWTHERGRERKKSSSQLCSITDRERQGTQIKPAVQLYTVGEYWCFYSEYQWGLSSLPCSYIVAYFFHLSPSFSSFILSLPLFSLSLSLSLSLSHTHTHTHTHSLCFHSKVGILHVLTITLQPPPPPSSTAPCSLSIFPVA